MLFGYARVSTTEQNPAHQLDALTTAGVEEDNFHLDYAAGAPIHPGVSEVEHLDAAAADRGGRGTPGGRQSPSGRGPSHN